MATKYLDNTGLAYFWGKIKSWVTSRGYITSSGSITGNAATATRLAGPKHSYTTAANAAKNWYRIANANTHQMDTSKPLQIQFMLTAWNPDQPADYYEQWFVDCQVYGRKSGMRIFGANVAPFSQARVLYENAVASIDTSDRPAIDIYLNYVLSTACQIRIEEIYNSGWTFPTDGVLAASTIPSGFENRAVGVQGSGVHQATNASYTTYTSLQRSNITANITLANSDTYRMRVLNCTNQITVTVPSIDNTYAWFLIKNFNAASTNKDVTIHPSTTSVLIDDSNADIVLKPGEWVIIASKAANSYTLIGDGRWKSQKADKATTLAGYGITDAKIANGTITLGSNSITPLTSVPSHNQASNTITAMTGYSKPSSTSAIASTDTLNQAIGKLEKAIDDADITNVVHLTGTETINGIKKFTSTMYNISSNPMYIARNTFLTKGISVQSLYTSWLVLHCDSQATDTFTPEARIGGVHYTQETTDAVYTSLIQYSKDSGAAEVYAALHVGYDASGNAFARAPSTSPSRSNGEDIVTRDWIPNDSRIVHTSGDETIGGSKYFSSAASANRFFYARHLGVKLGDTVSEDTTAAFCVLGSDGYRMAEVEYAYRSDGSVDVKLAARKNVSQSSDRVQIRVGYDASGNPYTFAPTPAAADDSSKIATTEWVRDATGNFACNAATATKLATARDINVSDADGTNTGTKITFDGSGNKTIKLPSTIKASITGNCSGSSGSCTGNAATATKLSAAKTISLTGDVTGSASFDGSANASITATVADDSHNHVISNVDGLQTALDAKAADSGVVHTTGAETISGIKTLSNEFVRAGVLVKNSDASREITLLGGTSANSAAGAKLDIYGASHATYPGGVRIQPGKTGAYKQMILLPDGTATWNGQQIQTASDERIKTPLSAVPDAVLDAWGDACWGQFQYLEAVASKGGNARLHLGLIAQRVKAAFEARGLDACAYGILCHEEHPATADEPAADFWTVRYGEALAMEAAYQRRRADRLEARIAALEERIS